MVRKEIERINLEKDRKIACTEEAKKERIRKKNLKEAEKERKKKLAQEKKETKEKNRKEKAANKQSKSISKDREVESEDSSSQADKFEENEKDLSGKICYSCSIDWFTCNEKIKWRSCEECNNWCCVGCIEGRFDANDEFFCNICVY